MKRIAFVAIASTLTAVAPSAPAEAAPNYPGVRGSINLWQNDGYDGCRKTYEKSADYVDGYDGSCDDYLRVSSFVNKTGDWWILHTGRDLGGARLCVRPWSHDANIGNDTAYEDDIKGAERRGSSQPVRCDDVTGSSNN